MGAGRPSKRRRVESAESREELKSSLLLSVPLELRLQIYDYALSDVTITVAEQQHNIFDTAEDGGHRIEGLPASCVPLVKNEYDPNMMMVGRSPVMVPCGSLVGDRSLPQWSSAASLAGVSMDSGYASAGSSMYSVATASTASFPAIGLEPRSTPSPPAVTNVALLQVNRQVRAEMLSHLQSRTCKQTTLYATYPYGLLVLRQHYPALLKLAKHVVISGQYISIDPALSTASPPQSPPPPPPNTTVLASSSALVSLARTMYSTYRTTAPQTFYATMPTLHMRIYYPDERKYSAIWGDGQSPIVRAVGHIPAGDLECKTWRSRTANAVTVKVHPPKDPAHRTSWRRNFSSVFRRIKAQGARSGGARRTQSRRTEEFWEDAFGDEGMFEAVVPEATCWNRA